MKLISTLPVALLLVACAADPAPEVVQQATTAPAHAETHEAAVEAPADEPAGPDVSAFAAQLSAADLADGAEDHVVSKCAGCALGMDGDPAHASTAGEYELHLCSESCKANFDADPAAVLGRLPAGS